LNLTEKLGPAVRYRATREARTVF